MAPIHDKSWNQHGTWDLQDLRLRPQYTRTPVTRAPDPPHVADPPPRPPEAGSPAARARRPLTCGGGREPRGPPPTWCGHSLTNPPPPVHLETVLVGNRGCHLLARQIHNTLLTRRNATMRGDCIHQPGYGPIGYKEATPYCLWTRVVYRGSQPRATQGVSLHRDSNWIYFGYSKRLLDICNGNNWAFQATGIY